MTEKQTVAALAEEISRQERECDRGIIAVGLNFRGAPMGGLALVAPKCVLFSQIVAFHPSGEPVFLDLILN